MNQRYFCNFNTVQNMKVKKLLVAALLLIAAASYGQTYSPNVITTGVPFVSINPDSRGGAMGDCGVATSGNYRNYYVVNGERRSHTIDPRTGYPVHHNLLSATVIASSCMRADALATTCMVMGETQAMELIEETEDAACYFIIADNDKMYVETSQRWKELFGDDSEQE